MKIAFLVHRKNYYKYFSPLIEEALKRGHSVFCIHDLFWVAGTSKAYDIPKLTSVPLFQSGQPKVLAWENPEALISLIQEHDIELLVFLNTHPVYAQLQENLRQQQLSVRWVAVQHASDVLLCTRNLLSYDLSLVFSDRWVEWIKEVFQRNGGRPDEVAALASKLVAVGDVDLDSYAAIDPEMVRQRLEVPSGKKVVLLLPFPFGSSVDRFWSRYIYGASSRFPALAAAWLSGRPRWIRQAYRGENDRNVIRAIRRFCDANNAFFIIKSRLKDPVRPYAHLLADKVLYDEEIYPSTIAQCLAISDVCIHFSSNVAYEAAFRGIPSVAILPSQRDYKDFRTYGPYVKLRETMEFSGVSRSWSIAESIIKLPTLDFEQLRVDPTRRSLYIETYLGFDDGRSAKRSLIALESLPREESTHHKNLTRRSRVRTQITHTFY